MRESVLPEADQASIKVLRCFSCWQGRQMGNRRSYSMLTFMKKRYRPFAKSLCRNGKEEGLYNQSLREVVGRSSGPQRPMPALLFGPGCSSTPSSRLGLGHCRLGRFGKSFWQRVYVAAVRRLTDRFREFHGKIRVIVPICLFGFPS